MHNVLRLWRRTSMANHTTEHRTEDGRIIKPVSIPRQVGLYARREREAQGLTRKQLAKAAGVSERLLASLELGDAPASASTSCSPSTTRSGLSSSPSANTSGKSARGSAARARLPPIAPTPHQRPAPPRNATGAARVQQPAPNGPKAPQSSGYLIFRVHMTS